MKKYIGHTTNLINDETLNVVSLDLKRKDGPKDPWKSKPELLDLMESQYYKLIDVYLFDILLPDRGYDQTKEVLLKEIAMEKAYKLEYLDKIGDYYCNSIRETSLIHGTEALQQLNKAKVKEQMKNRVEEIKNLSNHQQGENEEEEEESDNPLFHSTFNRKNFNQRRGNRNNNSSSWTNYLFKLKLKASPKVFLSIVSLVVIIWLWRGGYKRLRNFKLFKFLLLHIFGVGNKK